MGRYHRLANPKRLARHLGRVRRAHRNGWCGCGADIPRSKRGNHWFRTQAKYRAASHAFGKRLTGTPEDDM